MPHNIILTGLPHSGKTSLLERLIEPIKDKKGFITKELLKDRQRTGFEAIRHDGETALLAHERHASPYKVSKYYVYPDALETLFPELTGFGEELLYIDEIGQMELLSRKFQQLARSYLDAQNPFVGTMSQVCKHPFIAEVSGRADVTILTVTPSNRESIYKNLRAHLIELL